jgi:hypothetical protein
MHVKVEHAKSCKLCGKCEPEVKIYVKRHRCNVCIQKNLSPERRMIKDAKYRAKKKNIPFNLVLGDIKIPDKCPVLNIPMKRGGNKWDSPSLDRIDNTKGYTKDNIIVVSFRANHFKNFSTVEELEKVVAFYKKLKSHK